jgi:hypothetical protein
MSVMVAKARSMSASGAREDRACINLSEGSEILSGVQVPRAAGDALDRPHRYRATPPVVGAMRRIVAHVAPAPGRRHDPHDFAIRIVLFVRTTLPVRLAFGNIDISET